MKKHFITTISIALLSFSAFSQIEVKSSSAVDTTQSSTQGFFLNKGATKITSLECYNFSDLIVSFDIKKEYFEYDKIQILVHVGEPYSISSYAGRIFTQEEFAREFTGKKYGYIDIFSTTNMKEKSQYFEMNRADLEFEAGGQRYPLETKLKAIIIGYDIVDTKVVYKTKSDGSVEAVNENTVKPTRLTEFGIDLLNRKRAFRIPLLGGFPPSKPTEEGDCHKI